MSVVASAVVFKEVQYGYCSTDQRTCVFVINIHHYDLLERKTERMHMCI